MGPGDFYIGSVVCFLWTARVSAPFARMSVFFCNFAVCNRPQALLTTTWLLATGNHRSTLKMTFSQAARALLMTRPVRCSARSNVACRPVILTTLTLLPERYAACCCFVFCFVCSFVSFPSHRNSLTEFMAVTLVDDRNSASYSRPVIVRSRQFILCGERLLVPLT